MSIIPSEVEFGPGKLREAVSGQEVGFVPFIERVEDQPRSLSDLLGRDEISSPLSEVAKIELEEVLRYASNPKKRLAPLLVQLARDADQSLGSLAASTHRDVTEIELALNALGELGIIVDSVERGIVRYSLREDLTAAVEH